MYVYIFFINYSLSFIKVNLMKYYFSTIIYVNQVINKKNILKHY